jgi:YD repeat-containing protein
VTGPDPDGPGPLSAPVTSYSYDLAGNLMAVTDPLNHVTQYGHDARNRLTSVNDALGGITHYGYDLDNNRTSVTDAIGNATEFAYDVRDRLTGETDVLGQSFSVEYDPANHQVTKTDRNGRQVALTFNERDEPLTETWTSAAGTTDNVIHYSYDDDGNARSIADNVTALAYTYTNRNQVATVDNGGTPNVPHVVLAYTYDPAGNVRTLTATNNSQADLTNTYTPDPLNRIAEITQAGPDIGDKRVDLGYNEIGQLATISRFTDLAATQAVVHTTYTYDGLNRLTNLVHSHDTTVVAFYQYTFDSAGRITEVVSNDGITTYTPDALGQLLAADAHNPANPAES